MHGQSAEAGHTPQAHVEASPQPGTHADSDAITTHAQAQDASSHANPSHEGHASPAMYWVLPFVVMLGFIALAPLINAHWWEHRYPWVAAALFAVGLGYYLLVRGDLHPWLHEMKEYVSFVCLLFALFVVSGGIAIAMTRTATPGMNVRMLLIGAVLANLFGTTGAAMLLIRPYLRINREHLRPYHVVFFIFIVANVGGCLTPVGDPPLFLGYLKGVPFEWELQHCLIPWAIGNSFLLATFYVIDSLDHKNKPRTEDPAHDSGPALRINGYTNFLLILGVVGAVFLPSVFEAFEHAQATGTINAWLALGWSREVTMVSIALLSRQITPPGIYEHNGFSWNPIKEVAILFAAIFSTMVPALEYLDAHADDMPLHTPGQYYFATGALSSVLDNAPTYLTFLQVRLGEIDPRKVEDARAILAALGEQHRADPTNDLVRPTIADIEVRSAVDAMLRHHRDDVYAGEFDDTELRIAFLTDSPTQIPYLLAISIGAVFFGACTYIGNAPNFMVKSIAENAGLKMPTFLGYVLRYTLPVMLPMLVLVWFALFVLGFVV